MKYIGLKVMLVALLLSDVVPASAQWSTTALSVGPNQIYGSAEAISDNGVVAGYILDNSFGYEPCIWISDKPQIIASGSFTNVEISGINDSGQIVGHAGTYIDSTSSTFGFLYSNNSLTLFQNGDSASFWPNAMNDSGLVAGGTANGAGTYGIATGAITNFGTFGASSAEFTAVSNNGLLVGQLHFEGALGPQGFVLDNNQIYSLDALGDTSVWPTAVNNNGIIVGSLPDIGKAVTWTVPVTSIFPDTTIAANVLPILPDAIGSSATDINASGDIVGSMWINNQEDAVLWTDGQAINLNTLLPPDSGWMLNNATGINDSGQIVGDGTYDGQEKGFLLTPIPEPATISLAAGFYFLANRRRQLKH